MPLDHYIPQVHLRKFCSPVLDDRLYAIRKSNLKSFTPNPKAVCAIHDGSTNAYLRQDRAIEEFLKTIEPKYNSALEKLIDKRIDDECIYTIAGFVASVASCSPAGVRLRSGSLKNKLEIEATMLDSQGMFPPPPAVLAGKTFTELLNSGRIKIVIDKKFPQAMGIASILQLAATFGNFTWEILQNDSADSPFFTSDFPVAVEKSDDPDILNRIVPLAPNLALRIKPDRRLHGERLDFSFANFKYRMRKVTRNDITKLNCLIVRCAEDVVFFRDDHPWIVRFIAKNRRYRVELHSQKIKTPTGTLLVSTQRVVRVA
jgi:Protein of unknown function (DUF4238)